MLMPLVRLLLVLVLGLLQQSQLLLRMLALGLLECLLVSLAVLA